LNERTFCKHKEIFIMKPARKEVPRPERLTGWDWKEHTKTNPLNLTRIRTSRRLDYAIILI
jgi:hypothetical protein